ncbi:MAG TPA: histidine kinase [Chitinophaga sp.]|uniref:sensor histidine kinase n=1 Tax=Chitinophaga sp. TaxID=1869181 RepID=UPI002BC7CAA3|nr:histidine kinase [Chitinophaga sp.]HVI45028.1 histidine kinase [Chitinophaga sp.]
MKKYLPFVLHFLFWMMPVGMMIYFSDFSRKTNIYAVIYFIMQIGWFYVNLLVLLPRLMKRKKIWLLLLSYILVFALDALLSNGISYLLGTRAQIRLLSAFFTSLFVTGFFLVFSGCYYILKRWLRSEAERKSWENEKLKAELDFLKSQINPHFLFNTLNNIYSLTYTQSPQAPEAVMLLSEIMRYMLYDSSSTEVPLEKEVAHIREMISLHALRVTGKFAVTFEVTGEVTEMMIAPLILVPFVENVFKHGVVNDREDPVKIWLHMEKNGIHFYLRNRTDKGNGHDTRPGGIGIKNVTRRLELLYGKRQSLYINRQQDHFEVNLYVQLKKKNE